MTAFVPTHTLTINGDVTAVACVDDDWTPCEPNAGAQLVTREEWEAEGSVSCTLADDGNTLQCNGDPWGIIGEWALDAITSAGVAGEAEGHEDRRHDDGEVCDEDGAPIAAAPRAPRAWANEALAADYRAHYSAARGG
jgi:hypothetical protein